VFKYTYLHACLLTDPHRKENGGPDVCKSQFTSSIESHFCQYAIEVASSGTTVTDLHQKNLSKYQSLWRSLHSNSTCLACLQKQPENTLTCGHSICQPCTIAYSSPNEVEPWTDEVKTCPLCTDANTIVFYRKPDTAGIRTIIAEGGGVRGVIPLTFLKQLERTIDLPMDIREHFDMAIGSSSGRLHLN
jgi:hypothetical protein